MKSVLRNLIVLLLICQSINIYAQKIKDQFTSPSKHFGFAPGTDRMLFDYDQLIKYLKVLDEESERIEIREIGESPMGKKMYLVFLSSEKNIQTLDTLKWINKQLALNPNLSERELSNYLENGKVFILATLSMHSDEVGPTQSAPLIAWEIATTEDPHLLKWLDDVVYMMVPNANPDGMDMVVKHYMESKGTPYEGGQLPKVYHKYVGHDNNRDFLTLTQKDNRVIAEIYNKSWFPHVLVEKHQMAKNSIRYMVPPLHDPISDNIDERLYNWSWIFGSNMATDMAEKDLAGVAQHYLFDDYFVGYTTTSQWKNVISLYTECASVQYAKPIFIDKNELTVFGKGLSEHKKSINMPKPWPGGWWRLGDIVEYELESTWSLIKTGAIHREELLLNRNELCKKEIEKGRQLAPAYYILPHKQHDASELVALLNLLNEHGITIYRSNAKIEYDARVIEKGDYVLPLAQPFRAFIKEVMEKQKFPERHYTPEGKLIGLYDISTWSLPLHRGVNTWQIDCMNEAIESSLNKLEFPILQYNSDFDNAKYLLFSVCHNESYKVAFNSIEKGLNVYRATEEFIIDSQKVSKGDFILEWNVNMKRMLKELNVSPVPIYVDIGEGLETLEQPAIGLIESNFHDKDAGWTRFIFDSYNIPFTVIKPENVNDIPLEQFDVLVFPDVEKTLLLKGHKKGIDWDYNISSYDPQYIIGMGDDGIKKLIQFVNDGGKIISWGESCNLFFGIQSLKLNEEKELKFQLPVTDISPSLKEKGLRIPGTLLNVELINDHPLTLGMQTSTKVLSFGRPILSTSVPYFDMDRRVIARFSEDEVLASGYMMNGELLRGKSAMVWVKKGKGQFIFYGFSPQFRASTQGTYKLLFNALLLK